MKSLLNKKEIMELAMFNIKTDTSDPYQAILNAVETWLIKKDMMIIPKLPKGRSQETGD